MTAGNVVERDVVFAGEGAVICGTLARPRDRSAWTGTAILLLAGSGPQDRDERILAVAPLRDLARGLAAAGNAVLRFDKRTARGEPARIVTVEDEVLGDARAAVAWLRTETAARRIIVAGHSLGGMLVPRLLVTTPGIDGGILLTPNARPLHVLLLDQLRREKASPALKAAEELSARIARGEQGSEVVLGAPLSYWSDLAAYDPVATARSMQFPLLLIFGSRDEHILPADVTLWREGLQDRPGVTIRVLDGLNHLLMAGEDGHYEVPNFVSERALSAIDAWLAQWRTPQ